MTNNADLTVRPDAKGRVTLGALAKGVSSYRISAEADGRLILEPYVEIPARERWVYDNPQVLASLERGIADAAAGRVKSRGSFSKYLKE